MVLLHFSGVYKHYKALNVSATEVTLDLFHISKSTKVLVCFFVLSK